MKLRSRLSRGALVTIALAVLTGVGIVGYLSFGYPPWVAVSMTLLTLTTVGFPPGSHLSTGELVFTAGLAFLGVGLFFVILVQIRLQPGFAIHDDERHAAGLQLPGDGPADPAVGADDEVSA